MCPGGHRAARRATEPARRTGRDEASAHHRRPEGRWMAVPRRLAPYAFGLQNFLSFLQHFISERGVKLRKKARFRKLSSRNVSLETWRVSGSAVRCHTGGAPDHLRTRSTCHRRLRLATLLALPLLPGLRRALLPLLAVRLRGRLLGARLRLTTWLLLAGRALLTGLLSRRVRIFLARLLARRGLACSPAFSPACFCAAACAAFCIASAA